VSKGLVGAGSSEDVKFAAYSSPAWRQWVQDLPLEPCLGTASPLSLSRSSPPTLTLDKKGGH
jgi:hypothetical protein